MSYDVLTSYDLISIHMYALSKHKTTFSDFVLPNISYDYMETKFDSIKV